MLSKPDIVLDVIRAAATLVKAAWVEEITVTSDYSRRQLAAALRFSTLSFRYLRSTAPQPVRKPADWSPNYIQHSAHIAPGREVLFDLIKSMPPPLTYELGTIVAEKDFVIVHG